MKSKESDLLREKLQGQSSDREKADLQAQLQEKEKENQQLRAKTQKIISDKDVQLQAASEGLAAKELKVTQAQGSNPRT